MKEIPQWQKDLVLDRIKKVRQNPERLLDWKEASKMLYSDETKMSSDVKKFWNKLKSIENPSTIQRQLD
jgi:hypothetical protein